MRLRINDLGETNGFVETFWDGVFKTRQENMQFRAADTDAAGSTTYIDKIFEGFWFGGAGSDYASDADNYIMYDNITAYYYLPGHPDYRSGFSNTGITPVIASGHQYAPDFFVAETFTAASGSIRGYTGSRLAPDMVIGDVVTKTIDVGRGERHPDRVFLLEDNRGAWVYALGCHGEDP